MGDPPSLSGLQRYGISVSPFDRSRPLDPLRRLEDAPLLVGRERLDAIEAYIDAAVDADQTAYIMVAGLNGTGRTSVCNHLLEHYRRKQGVSKLLVPEPNYEGRDPYVYYVKWLDELYGEAQMAGLVPLGAEPVDLDVEFNDPIPNGNVYESKARRLMRAAAPAFAAKDARFAVCIEDPVNYEVVRAAFGIFEQAATIVLVTALDPFEGHHPHKQLFRKRPPKSDTLSNHGYPVVELELVRGPEARDLVERRWESCRTGHPSPFDSDGLVDTFDRRHRTAGRVVVLSHKMLSYKAASAGHGPPWPTDDLRLRRDQILELVTQIDRGDHDGAA